MQTLPTWFLQVARVDRDGRLIEGERWRTLGSYDKDLAEYHADRLAEKGHVLITERRQLSKCEEVPIHAVRPVSLLQLLEEGPESASVYYAICDLTEHDRTYWVSSFLGFEPN
jgi:hypothetical protein